MDSNKAQDKKVTKRNALRQWMLRIVLLLLLLILLTPLILHIKPVQNFLVGRITKNISKRTESEVRIERVDFSVFKGLIINELFVSEKGSATDTLVHVGAFSSSLSQNILSLVDKRLYLGDLTIEDVYVNVHKSELDTISNLEYFISHFASDSGASNQSSGNALEEFEIENINLKNIRFNLVDESKKEERYIQLGKGEIQIKDIQLENDSFVFERIYLYNPVYVHNKFGEKVENTGVVKDSIAVQKDTTQSNEIYLEIKDLSLDKGRFAQYSGDKDIIDSVEFGLNTDDIDVSEIALKAEDLKLNGPINITAEIKELSLQEHNGFKIEDFNVDSLSLNSNEILLSSFSLNTDKSILRDYLNFSFDDFSSFKDFATAVNIDTDMAGSMISFEDLSYFFPELRGSRFFRANKNRKLNLTGKIVGTVDELDADNVFLSIDNKIELSGTLSTYKLTDSESALINLYVDELNTSLRNLQSIIPGFKPPSQFYKLDPISFTGDIEGFFNDIVIYGNLKSKLGNVILDTRLNTAEGVNKARYSGEIALRDFDVASWTGNPDFGIATISAKIEDGQGLTLETVKTDLTAEINRFDFKGYEYSSIALKGILEKNLFNGTFTAKDENVDMDFDGTINIQPNYIKSDFAASINKVNLVALNLSEDFSNIHGDIDLSIEGSSITDFIGSADIKNLDLIFRDKPFDFDDVYLSSAPGEKQSRNLILTSKILNASLDGIFDLAQIKPAFEDYIFTHHNEWAKKLKFKAPTKELTNQQNFAYKIEIFDTKDYLELAKINDLRIQGLTIQGSTDMANAKFETNIDIDSSQYKSVSFQALGLSLSSNKKLSKVLMTLDEVQTSGRYYEPLEIRTDVDNDSINIRIKTANVLDSVGTIDVAMKVYPENDNLVFNVRNEDLQMFSSKWQIEPDNKITYGDKYISIDNFILSDQYRSINIRDYQNKGIELSMDKFDFLLINGLINYDKIDFAGEGSVFARVANIFDEPQIVGDVRIPEFTLNNVNYGSLGLRLDDDNGKVMASLNLSNAQDGMMLLFDAEYDKESKLVDGKVKARRIPMSTFEFIIDDGISETGGVANIDAVVNGPVSDLNLDGIAKVEDGQTRIDYIGVLIGLGNEPFEVTEDFIDLTDVSLYDRLGNRAVMTGGLHHDLFADFTTELNMRSERFLALDTDKEDNALYYGTGIGKMSIDYSGPFSKTDIVINAVTGPGTILNIPIEDSYSNVDQSFIKFVSREEIKRSKEEESIEEFVKLEGVDVDMNLTITEDAQVNMIFDERLNDVIKGWGNGDLRIIVSRDGNFNIYGAYEVDRGEYLFTAWGIVAKPFKVRSGGQITWTGDPINANLNIEANYDDLRAPVNVFLAEYLLGGNINLEQEARKRTQIDLTLKVGGTLYNPIVNFDLDFPELQGELMTFADSKMRILRENEADLNEQVAGLIMFRSFLPSNSLGNVFTTSSGFVETTYNTLSEFISNQLSYLLSGFLQEALTSNGFISGIDFEIGFSKNSNLLQGAPQSDNYLPDEIEVHFKPRFQNYKWGFDYGTSFVQSGQSTQVLQNYVVHDFVLEYYLTSDRRLKLRAYGKWDKDEVVFEDEQKYGVGINYRKEFGSITDFQQQLNQDLSKLSNISSNDNNNTGGN